MKGLPSAVVPDLTKHRTLLRVLWGVWLVGVVAGSLASGNDLSSLERAIPLLAYDKLSHFGAYAGLAFLSILAFGRRRGLGVALSMILLGAVLECGQAFSPGRTPDLADEAVNGLGVFSGIACAFGFRRRLRLSPEPPADPRTPVPAAEDAS